MPIFDQGYQHWDGQLSGHAWRWLTIARHGIRAQLKNRWTRRLMLFAWAPALALVGVLIFWGLLEQQSELIMPILQAIRPPKAIMAGPEAYRVAIWTLCYHYFFQLEFFFSMVLVLLVGPNLISQDLRFNAIPLYFSRPLRRIDYFAGKLGVIGGFLAAVVILPAVAAYVLGVCFSLDWGVLQQTAHLLYGSVLYGLVIVFSAGTLMLALSSLTHNARYVGLLWVAVWFVSNMVAAVLMGILNRDWCAVVSYSTNVRRLGNVIFDTESAIRQLTQIVPPVQRRRMLRSVLESPFPWYWSAAVLIVLFGLSLWILTMRVRSLDRLK